MTTKEAAIRQIEKELATARSAKTAGNIGMARVCARRAAGLAITYWLQKNPKQNWGADAMSQLKAVQNADVAPHAVREAARRLSTKVIEGSAREFSTHPLADSKIVLDFFLEDEEG